MTHNILDIISQMEVGEKVIASKIAKNLGCATRLVTTTSFGMRCVKGGKIVPKNCAACTSWNGSRGKNGPITVCPNIELTT